MKRLLVVMVLFSLALLASAQQPATASQATSVPGRGGDRALPAAPPYTTADLVEQTTPIVHADVYCAGYIGEPAAKGNYVVGGLETANTTRFAERDLIFLKGTGYKPGTRVSLVRPAKDPDVNEAFSGQKRAVKGLGGMVKDLGYADVIELREHDVAVAQVEFSCEGIVPGDLVVPFEERALITLKPQHRVDRFPAGQPATAGRIVQSKDFDQFVASGRKVYLDMGANKGLKVGDQLWVTRGYKPGAADRTESLTYKTPMSEETQRDPAKAAVPSPYRPSPYTDMPRRVLGGLVVLSVHPNSATAMVTYAMDAIHVGDMAELLPAGQPAAGGGN